MQIYKTSIIKIQYLQMIDDSFTEPSIEFILYSILYLRLVKSVV